MKTQKLFALTGTARGAARLTLDENGGTLAVELAGYRGACEAWLVLQGGALLHAPLGPAMRAAVPAKARDAAGVFLSSGGAIIARGGNGLSAAQMDAASLRVLAQLAQRKKETAPPELQTLPPRAEQAAPAQAAPPQQASKENRASTLPAGSAGACGRPAAPGGARTAQMLREEGPPVESDAARAIVSMANRLFYPPGADDAPAAYLQTHVRAAGTHTPAGCPHCAPPAGQKPTPPAAKHGAHPPMYGPHKRHPRGRSGRPY